MQPSEMIEPVLDERLLAELYGILGEDLRGIVQQLLDQLPEQCHALHGAVAGGELLQVKKLAHSIKGGAGNLGAVALSAAAARLEMAAAGGDRAATGGLMEEVDSLAHLTEAALQRFLDERR